MKNIKWIMLLFSLAIAHIAAAQIYGNEWIDYSKTYYKFRLSQDGLYRIPTAELDSAGLAPSSLVGSHFRLFRNGVEVPLYVTNNGVFGPSDYIEFYGFKNDGKTDTELYENANWQPHTYYSLFNDTASFFLVIDPVNPGLRYANVNNVIAGAPPKEPYFIHTSRAIYTGRYNWGGPFNPFYGDIGDSEYVPGEGYGDGFYVGPTTVNKVLPTAKIYQGASPNPVGKVVVTYYNTGKTHDVLFKIGTKSTRDISTLINDVRRLSLDLDKSDIVEGTTTVSVSPQITGEWICVHMAEIIYARQFDFENQTFFRFGIDKNTDTYIEIANFNVGSATPVLYDQINNQRIVGIVEGGLVKFRLPAAAQKRTDLLLTSEDPAVVRQVTSFEAKTFTNFNQVAQQGNYMIISSKRLAPATDGNNYLEAYKNYRSSAEGGSWNARVVYIDELEDQFGYGIKYGTLALTHFARFGVDKFSTPLNQIFIIGKGFGPNPVRINATTREQLMVQSLGLPVSDNLLVSRSAADPRGICGIGRLSVSSHNQVKDYLEKIRSVEANYIDTSATAQTIENKSWQKQILHLAGGNTSDEQNIFRIYMESYEDIIEGPYFGGNVSMLSKNVSDPIQVAQNIFLDSLFKSGLSLITFFGHAATTTIDFNIVPESMENAGRQPVMLSNGCFVGNIFQTGNLLSERFVLTPNQGTIAYIAPFSFAVAPALNNFSRGFYQNLGVNDYGKPLGTIMQHSLSPLINSFNMLEKIIAQQMIYHGDPAIKLSYHATPDYAIDQRSVSFVPEVINLGRDSFDMNIAIHNLGKAIDGEFTVYVERKYPNGEIEIYTQDVAAPYFLDTVMIRMATNKTIGAGVNSFKIKVDYNDEYTELSEFNNEITIDKTIFDDDIVPLIPEEFAIVTTPEEFKLYFSTVNAFSIPRTYVLQIDTTENYNSPLFQEVRITQSGGVVTWEPTIARLQDKVYYFRSSLDTLYGNPLSWNTSSFLYNTSLTPGWNQSHYFQFLKDKYNTMKVLPNRKFAYSDDIRTLQLVFGNLGVIPPGNVTLSLDGFLLARNSFARYGFVFFVYDVQKADALTTYNTGNGLGPYNDLAGFTTPGATLDVIQFNAENPQNRQNLRDFINNHIPDEAIVFVYSFGDPLYSQWEESTFQAFESIGASQIRQVVSGQPYFLFSQKGNPSFPIEEAILPTDRIIDTTVTFASRWFKGSVNSTLIGPASDWGSFDFDLSQLENPSFDENYFAIYGLPLSGLNRTELFNGLRNPINDLDIDAEQYPYLQLEWFAEDDSNTTPSQLEYWRVLYTKVPEAAINPQAYLEQTDDTVFMGGSYSFYTAFQNLTNIGMDSVLVKYTVKGPSGEPSTFYKRYAPLAGNDTIHVGLTYEFTSQLQLGINTIIIEANPDNDQPERYHPNNFAIVNVYVSKDIANPMLDVTFDGRHIVDGDIVSTRPEIRIKLTDENKFLALDDTSSFTIFLIDPLDPTNPQEISLADPRVEFFPADPNNLDEKNEAIILFHPEFERDGTYQLRVQGADRSNNDAGEYDYRVSFEIISRPAISNMLNYPNPFTTSTQFVFTLTGTEVPEDIMIQIMTVTGKVVREIRREELGPIRIGQNITEFKWDGTDQYGDRLANGLYLYRVKAKLNGITMDKFDTGTDKFFKKGYGKMYLMR